jgi:enamine deaminase RidA (YjgF/YER057c/UK114 family)
MTIKRINPGARYSSVVVHNGTAYCAGQVAKLTAGKSVGEQTAEVLSLLDAQLASAGTDKSKLLLINIYLSDISTFAEMNVAFDTWVDKNNMAARVTVEAKIANPLENIEISAIAAVD